MDTLKDYIKALDDAVDAWTDIDSLYNELNGINDDVEED